MFHPDVKSNINRKTVVSVPSGPIASQDGSGIGDATEITSQIPLGTNLQGGLKAKSATRPVRNHRAVFQCQGLSTM